MFGKTFVAMKWNWVIQSLASFKLVDASILAVKKAPTISDDLGKDAREMVSLRMLESMFIQENEAIVDTDSAQNSKISFDLSERSEDVLQKILETSEPMTELERQKFNVRPFILHKRASLPKSPLQKLKEALLESSHPVLESLKEQGNIDGENVSENTDTIPEVDVDLNADTMIAKGDSEVDVDLDARTTVAKDDSEVDVNPNAHTSIAKDDFEVDVDPNAHTTIANDDSEVDVDPNTHTTIANDDSEVDVDLNTHTTIANDDSVVDVNLNAHTTIANDDSEVDASLNAHTTIAKDDLVLRNTENENNKSQESQLLKSDHVENSTSGNIEDTGRNEHEVSIEPPVKGLEENTSMDHVEQDNLPYVSPSGPSCEGKILMGNLVTRNAENEKNKLQESQLSKSERVENSTSGIMEDIGRNEHEISIEPPIKGLEENTLRDHIELDNLPYVSTTGPSGEGKMFIEDDSRMEIDSDSGISDDERTDIAAKKEAFLSSQGTLSQDFMATIDCTEISLCMKCNKDGALLVCSSNACPIRVHETCLASAADFDENGNYFCPFCSYYREISKYLEVKKKASLARKDLQAFLKSKFKHRPKVSSKNKASLNRDKSREIGAAGETSEVNGCRHTTNSGREESEDCAPADPTDSLHQPKLKHSRPKRKYNQKESLALSSVVSSHFKRPRNLEPQYISPTIPLARRKILPWTKMEEDTLKEGVENFPSVNNKGIPWTLILDFGRDVFDKSRTTVDLKDKWRNICKGIPENKRRNYKT